MLEGLARYAKEAGWWLDLGLAGHGMQIPERWDGDGIIGLIGRSTELRKLIEVSALPTVLLSMDPADLVCPRVVTDHDAIVTEAIAHFESQRFRRYIVFDVMDSPTQFRRNNKFVEQASARGHECVVFKSQQAIADGMVPVSVVNEMAEFLRGQSKPAAVFCAQDDFAQFVLEAAAQAGAKVPDEIAVLGVNNDHLLCDFSEPTLSSVDTRQSELGYRGAATLDKLMNGEEVPPMTKIAPIGVVARRSTEIWSTEDLLARSALNFIWSSYRNGLQVSDVAKKEGVSKVALNNRFQRAFNTSVSAEISRRRIEEAKRLLRDEGKNAGEVCKILGYKNLETFSRAFKRISGLTATSFRLGDQS